MTDLRDPQPDDGIQDQLHKMRYVYRSAMSLDSMSQTQESSHNHSVFPKTKRTFSVPHIDSDCGPQAILGQVTDIRIWRWEDVMMANVSIHLIKCFPNNNS